MKTNLTWRTVVIVVTILICVFGIIGIPKSGADVKKNFSKNIKLGLDLKGCTHLVMQVQVQDAVKADAEQTAERLKEGRFEHTISIAGPSEVRALGRALRAMATDLERRMTDEQTARREARRPSSPGKN